ncbi:large conductance mechanosensitive channel protein MscL [Anabaena catenula]|uniref:Large-conductance mechanosensitive channel n=1 Tax=Anabaena catenula FACHB-362 TaxID=2692877 RepID=A0ABR8J8E1_9NOST|nr:large conductance mechanosensitive channel protein MscL [Anabaena catenula]MBD2694641.1 large conductance mechanosensitive channel protein MscL [Anabaena catenula FACHB-362]
MAKINRRARSLINDFREFALKGNVVDLAIAFIIGGAFGKIVTSFVEDVIMPLINPLVALPGQDWRTISIGPGIALGRFFGSIVDFLIIAFVLFVTIQALQKFKRQEQIATQAPPPDPNVAAQERLTEALNHLTQTLATRNPQL